MNYELLLLIKKHIDTLIEQAKSTPQELLAFKLNKQMETFSFNPPVNLIEEKKWLMAVTIFEVTNSVFKVSAENNSFSTTTPDHWYSRGGAGTFNRLQKILELRSQNIFELRVKEARKRGNQIKTGYNEYKLSDIEII